MADTKLMSAVVTFSFNSGLGGFVCSALMTHDLNAKRVLKCGFHVRSILETASHPS